MEHVKEALKSYGLTFVPDARMQGGKLEHYKALLLNQWLKCKSLKNLLGFRIPCMWEATDAFNKEFACQVIDSSLLVLPASSDVIDSGAVGSFVTFLIASCLIQRDRIPRSTGDNGSFYRINHTWLLPFYLTQECSDCMWPTTDIIQNITVLWGNKDP